MQAWELDRELGKAQDKLEAIRKYCSETLEATEDFPNWNRIIRKLMRDILKILDGPSCSEEATEMKKDG